MNTFIFTKFAKKKFHDLPQSIQVRIFKKLKTLKNHDDIFAVLKQLHHLEPATHRLRVGNYRLILELRQQTNKEILFHVVDVGDRRDIYR